MIVFLIIPRLVSEACLMVMPKDPKKFNLDNVRIGKVAGGSFSDSCVIDGFCSARKMLSNVSKGENVKVAIYSHELQPPQSESKSTVLIKNAEELLNYSKSEEEAMEKAIKEIVDSGTLFALNFVKFCLDSQIAFRSQFHAENYINNLKFVIIFFLK